MLDLRKNNETLNENNKILEEKLANALENVKNTMNLKENYGTERDKSIKLALKQQNDEYLIEKSRQNELFQHEIQKIRDEASNNINMITTNLQVSLIVCSFMK